MPFHLNVIYNKIKINIDINILIFSNQSVPCFRGMGEGGLMCLLCDALVGPFGRYPPKVSQKQKKKKIVRSCLDFLSQVTQTS